MSIYVREPGDWKESWVNFKPDEFRCSHCGALDMHEDILDLLQEARDAAEVARKANVASAKTKLQNLGLTIDEVKDAFNI